MSWNGDRSGPELGRMRAERERADAESNAASLREATERLIAIAESLSRALTKAEGTGVPYAEWGEPQGEWQRALESFRKEFGPPRPAQSGPGFDPMSRAYRDFFDTQPKKAK